MINFVDAVERGFINPIDAIVKESTYKRIGWNQKIYFEKGIEFADGESPVMMRGSKHAIALKYQVARWYSDEVFVRYLRMYRFTFLDSDEFWTFLHRKIRQPNNQFLRTSYSGLQDVIFNCGKMVPRNQTIKHHVIVNGKQRTVTTKQLAALRNMQILLRKFADQQ